MRKGKKTKNNIPNFAELHKSLQEQGYFCLENTASAVWVALHTRPIAGAFLFGPAGSGKSALPQVLAPIIGAEVVFFQCFPGTREDDLLVKIIPDDSTPSGVKLADGPVMKAARLSQRKKIFLVLDEWDKTRPSADSFLLDFLQSGRINYNGEKVVAQTQNLVVWVTMNDERELSEPLLRRLPLIKFNHLPVSIVRQALERTHGGHPHIPAVLILYERCLFAGMPKPATIQELRQLLDAISLLGERADWDSLVFQFVTKTKENHALLKQVEGYKVCLQEETEPEVSLDPQAYEYIPEEEKKETTQEKIKKPRMPRIAEIKKMFSVSQKAEELSEIPLPSEEEIEKSGGVVALSDDTYDAVVRLCDRPTPDPHDLEVAKVVGKKIILKAPIPIWDFQKVAPLKGQEGEVVFTASFPLRCIKELQKRGLKIVLFSEKEILGKTNGVDFRAVFSETESYYNCEIVVSLQEWEKFVSIFSLIPKIGETDDMAQIRWLLITFSPRIVEIEAKKNYNMVYHIEGNTLYCGFNYNFKGKTLEEVKKEVGAC